MRNLMMFLLLIPATATLYAGPTHSPNEHALKVLDRLLNTGHRITLSITVDAALTGTTNRGEAGRVAGEQLEAARRTFRKAFAGTFGRDGAFKLLDFAQSGTNPSRQVLYSAGANYAFRIRITGYAAPDGRIAMSETDGTLVRLLDGEVLAQDVAWATQSASGAKSIFINGVRVY